MKRYHKEPLSSEIGLETAKNALSAIQCVPCSVFTISDVMSNMRCTYDSFTLLWAIDMLESEGWIEFVSYGNLTQYNKYRAASTLISI